MSNVTVGVINSNNSNNSNNPNNPNNPNVLSPITDNKGVTQPIIKPAESNKPDNKQIQQNNAMSWTQVGLRGLYGAAACGVYISGQRAIFQQPLYPKDLAVVMGTCGLKAMVMSTAIKGIREAYRQFIPSKNNQLSKDIAEASIIDALEIGVTYFQDKATAKDVDFGKILGLSALRSYPNNFMDTKSYSNFVDWSSDKNKLKINPTDEEKAAFKQRKQSFENYVMTPLAALVTAIPATYLNNEPFTPTNFAKTVALRVASVKLWRKAMSLAKAHSGDDKPVETQAITNPTPQPEQIKQDKFAIPTPTPNSIPLSDTIVYPLTGKTI